MTTLDIGNHHLKMRPIHTPDGLIYAPSHVYRQPGGWQVKIERQDEPRFFKHVADSHYGSVAGSLSIAIESLYDELPNYRTFDQLRPGSSHWYSVRERLGRSGNVVCQCVQTYICGYQQKLRTINFYVGTPNTKTDKKLRIAIDRAIGTRCWSIDTIKSDGRSVLFELPVPKNVEKFAY